MMWQKADGKPWRSLLRACALFLALSSPAHSGAEEISPESLARLRQNLSEAKALLATWATSLNARESEIAERENFLKAIEQRLNEREAALSQNEAALQARESGLQAKEATLLERERLLSENEIDYQKSAQLISELKASLTTASSSLAQAQVQAAALELEVGAWRVAAGSGWIVAVVLFLISLAQ